SYNGAIFCKLACICPLSTLTSGFTRPTKPGTIKLSGMMTRLTIVMSLQTHGGHASETGFVKMDPVFLCLQFRQGYYM
ncbi:hypothetical protein K4G94_22460, partial [Mycobacterium tuberculosis]|uniref:hypothetical protein n=1 Tax=Mycobacterium tuberculosis TaxID=1773 RepID=UPI001C7DB702|nr:hypothetical protein [Mycobacterium tuberculosis]